MYLLQMTPRGRSQSYSSDTTIPSGTLTQCVDLFPSPWQDGCHCSKHPFSGDGPLRTEKAGKGTLLQLIVLVREKKSFRSLQYMCAHCL